jgi:hypothetical protein
VEDAKNCGLGMRGNGAGRLGSEETTVCWSLFSAIETKCSKQSLESEDSFPLDGPMDSVYDDGLGGEVLGIVIELELEDDKLLLPRLACSQDETSVASVSDDGREISKVSLSLVVNNSSEKHLLREIAVGKSHDSTELVDVMRLTTRRSWRCVRGGRSSESK